MKIIAQKDPSKNFSIINRELHEMTIDEMQYSLCRFILEIKKENGEAYPNKTLYELILTLQEYLQSLDMGKEYKFRQSDDFAKLKHTLDGAMKDRAKQGIGLQKRQAEIITLEKEELLWETKTLGIESPPKLDTLFYLIGLNFALRGGDEHCQLRGGPNSQLRLLDADTLQYTQDVSKSNQGGLKHKEIAPKQVLAYTIKDKPERCVVAVYKLYMTHCPVPHPGPFYL